MFKSLLVVAALPLLLLSACPGEPEPEGCAALGCAADAFCDAASDQCITDLALSDAALESCLRSSMDKPEGAISIKDARQVTSLVCTKAGVESLAGIEPMTGLQTLSLWESKLVDISPLAKLTELSDLQLGNNNIYDITPLEGLNKLERLGLQNNQIHDIDSLVGLVNLKWLNLDDNNIEVTDPLATLTNLTWLSIEHNPYQDTPTLSNISAAGCEVYKANHTALLRPVPGLLANGRANLKGLRYHISDDGEVQLAQIVNGFWQPYISAFAGRLRLDDAGEFHYQMQGIDKAVGYVDGDFARLCLGDYAEVCQLNLTVKNPAGEDALRWAAPTLRPVYSAQIILRDAQGRLGDFRLKAEGDADVYLDPYVIATPNQYDAGSCVFMANSGAMEILMHQDLVPGNFDYMDETDLSERFLMNAQEHVTRQQMPYFITDLQYVYNSVGGSLLSREYPFVVGYVDANDNRAEAGDDGASLSCRYNWFDDLPDGWQSQLTPTVLADRGLIFVDPNLDQYSIWKVGLMNDEVIERIKNEIRTKHQPVIVVYNHYRYWHAVIIYGFDDNLSIGECPMVHSTITYFEGDGDDHAAAAKIRDAMLAQGGCRQSGVFYVRDSISDGTADEPYYNYGHNVSDRYSRRVTLHTYDWVKYLANHAYTVQRKTSH